MYLLSLFQLFLAFYPNSSVVFIPAFFIISMFFEAIWGKLSKYSACMHTSVAAASKSVPHELCSALARERRWLSRWLSGAKPAVGFECLCEQ